MRRLLKKSFMLITVASFVFCLTGCAERQECLYPGCDNEAIGDTGACYKHGKNNPSRSSYTSDDESDVYHSYSDDDGMPDAYQSYNNDDNASSARYSYNNSGNQDSDYSKSKSDNSKNYNSDMYNYDNADDYADDYAEDYAYDEFGDSESEEAYEYGYEVAYDDWEEEMDE